MSAARQLDFSNWWGKLDEPKPSPSVCWWGDPNLWIMRGAVDTAPYRYVYDWHDRRWRPVKIEYDHLLELHRIAASRVYMWHTTTWQKRPVEVQAIHNILNRAAAAEQARIEYNGDGVLYVVDDCA